MSPRYHFERISLTRLNYAVRLFRPSTREGTMYAYYHRDAIGKLVTIADALGYLWCNMFRSILSRIIGDAGYPCSTGPGYLGIICQI